MSTRKTNAARILDKHRIIYDCIFYEVDENDLSATHLAAQLGQDPGRVFKTLVLHGDRSGYFVCLIPGNSELDLKKAAKASGNKNCALIPLKDLLPITGYIRGGCSPLGMKKTFPTYVHQKAEAFASIYISAGQRGLQLLLAPKDLLCVTHATMADIATE